MDRAVCPKQLTRNQSVQSVTPSQVAYSAGRQLDPRITRLKSRDGGALLAFDPWNGHAAGLVVYD